MRRTWEPSCCARFWTYSRGSHCRENGGHSSDRPSRETDRGTVEQARVRPRPRSRRVRIRVNDDDSPQMLQRKGQSFDGAAQSSWVKSETADRECSVASTSERIRGSSQDR
eukprot:116246-Pyramimonas_sp.AAC.1